MMSNDKTCIPDCIVILFFCISLVPYISAFIGNAGAQLILYFMIYSLIVKYIWSANVIKQKLNFFQLMLLLYVPMLGIRLLNDFVLPDKTFFIFGSSLTILIVYALQIVLPSLIFNRYSFHIDVKRIGIILSFILLICMTLSIIKIMNGEVEMTRDGRFDNGYGIFSIEFGHYGITLVLISILTMRDKLKPILKLTMIANIAVGLTASFLAGSRGPIMALIICLAIYTIARIKNIRRLILIILLILLLIPLLIVILQEFKDEFEMLGIRSFDRIYDSFLGDDGLTSKTSGRDTLIEDAIYYFLKSPIVGYSFLIPGKIYCHNIIVEQFMALGMFGGLCFLTINIIAVFNAWRIIRFIPKYSMIAILYLQYLIFGCLSITIINLPQYWLFLLLMMNISYQNKTNKPMFILQNRRFAKLKL